MSYPGYPQDSPQSYSQDSPQGHSQDSPQGYGQGSQQGHGQQARRIFKREFARQSGGNRKPFDQGKDLLIAKGSETSDVVLISNFR